MQLTEHSEQMQRIRLFFESGLQEIPFCSQQQQDWDPIHSGNSLEKK